VRVNVELFGTARLACGRRLVEVELPANSSGAILAAALANSCPQLVGVALREDQSGLLESYTLNLNGTEFVGSGQILLNEGDTLLLFSSQAGG
jgi:molybdopterin converting factor small subunit